MILILFWTERLTLALMILILFWDRASNSGIDDTDSILGEIPVLLTLTLMILILAILKVKVIALKSKQQDSAYYADIDDFKNTTNHEKKRNRHKYKSFSN